MATLSQDNIYHLMASGVLFPFLRLEDQANLATTCKSIHRGWMDWSEKQVLAITQEDTNKNLSINTVMKKMAQQFSCSRLVISNAEIYIRDAPWYCSIATNVRKIEFRHCHLIIDRKIGFIYQNHFLKSMLLEDTIISEEWYNPRNKLEDEGISGFFQSLAGVESFEMIVRGKSSQIDRETFIREKQWKF